MDHKDEPKAVTTPITESLPAAAVPPNRFKAEMSSLLRFMLRRKMVLFALITLAILLFLAAVGPLI